MKPVNYKMVLRHLAKGGRYFGDLYFGNVNAIPTTTSTPIMQIIKWNIIQTIL